MLNDTQLNEHIVDGNIYKLISVKYVLTRHLRGWPGWPGNCVVLRMAWLCSHDSHGYPYLVMPSHTRLFLDMATNANQGHSASVSQGQPEPARAS